MAEKIHILRNGGNLESLEEQPFATEVKLQELIGRHPELLAGDQMRPDDPLRWILIKREMRVEGQAVDHLLIDHEARPTLVEVKKGGNRDMRRTIVGQMLDYAAAAASVWSGDGMRRAFEDDARRRGTNAVGEVAKLLRLDDETNAENAEDFANQFWERAARNLSDGRLRLLFVVDEIPVGLEWVVKFLNYQTRDALEILAVEVKQYPGQFGKVLVTRLIGEDEPPGQDTSSLIKRYEPPRLGAPLPVGKAPKQCLCGCGKDTKKLFAPGHDAKLNATLGRVEIGTILKADVDLGYAAGRCRDNPDLFDYNRTGLFCSKYSCDDIIRLAQKQATLKQQS